MSRYVFDIETNGLLKDLDTVHSLVLKDLETGEVISCADHPRAHDCWSIHHGLGLLAEATFLSGHNIVDFDIPAIQKVYPEFTLSHDCIIRDTLLMSRLMYTDLRDLDFRRRNARGNDAYLPARFVGRHSLEAWGYRLKLWKGDYSQSMKERGLDPWLWWNQEMQDYCVQDVEVTEKLLKVLSSRQWSEESVQMEHDFAAIIKLQVEHGFPFDERKAAHLYGTLCTRRSELYQELVDIFPPWWQGGKEVIPKKTLNYKAPLTADRTEGAPFTPITFTTFNPGSRIQFAQRLKVQRGWKPQVFTADGRVQVDETILSGLEWPEAKLMLEYLNVSKLIGMIGEGNQAWLRLVKDGRIHGKVDTVGAYTRRCTHKQPNLTQVPASYSPRGRECRELFGPPEGYVQVGWDASGLELRCLAHYMARYDDGAYGQLILTGDVHTANQEAAGLPTRDNAKTFIYAYIYGAGDEMIGAIVGKGSAEGKRLKAMFLKKTPALALLRKQVEARLKETKGVIKSIDGGLIKVRHKHAALNTLLQSAGAIAMKKALVILYNDLSTRGWVHGREYVFLSNNHDEVQAGVKPECVEEYKRRSVSAIRQAGVDLGFRCPLDGEAKHGASWADTH